MLYSLNRLVDDWNIVVSGTTKREDIPSVGSTEEARKQARLRIIGKLTVTLIVIALSSSLIGLSVRTSLVKLGFVGLGWVFGYWSR